MPKKKRARKSGTTRKVEAVIRMEMPVNLSHLRQPYSFNSSRNEQSHPTR